MAVQSVINFYNSQAEELCTLYEKLQFEDLYADLIPILPIDCKVLDIGAGSGRDAAWFYRHGYEVTAIEPSSKMIEIAKYYHKEKIEWKCDSLPFLKSLTGEENKYKIIILSGVWMHIPHHDRESSIKRLSMLNTDDGLIIISLRHGPPDKKRTMFKVSYPAIRQIAQTYGYSVIKHSKSLDQLKREDIKWEVVVLRKGS